MGSKPKTKMPTAQSKRFHANANDSVDFPQAEKQCFDASQQNLKKLKMSLVSALAQYDEYEYHLYTIALSAHLNLIYLFLSRREILKNYEETLIQSYANQWSTVTASANEMMQGFRKNMNNLKRSIASH